MPMMIVTTAPDGYSEKLQEDVYLSQRGPDLQPYNETLQDDVYLDGVAALPTRTPLTKPKRHSTQPALQISFQPSSRVLRGRTTMCENRMPSRTPSPVAATDSIAAAASSLWSFVSDTLTASHHVDVDQLTPNTTHEKSILDQCTTSAKAVPVKHTFIHYSTADSDTDPTDDSDHGNAMLGLSRSSSAPGIMLRDVFHIIEPPTMSELHVRRECQPCSYFHSKKDGCRWGDDCTFCHMCPADELKRRKKEKKEARRLEKLKLFGENETDDSLPSVQVIKIVGAS
jgi:hypothetical protein